MFFSNTQFMNKLWVSNYILDTFLKSLFKFLLSLIYFGLAWFLIQNMNSEALQQGQSLPEAINNSGTRRNFLNQGVTLLIAILFLFTPYWKFIALFGNPILAYIHKMPLFERKNLKKKYKQEKYQAVYYAQANQSEIHENFSTLVAWRDVGCPEFKPTPQAGSHES